MNDILKQRLVGALILLALGVVFWPIIFVQPEERQVADQLAIPPPPIVSTEPVETPDAGGLRGSPPLETTGENGEKIESAAAQEAPAADMVDTAAPPLPTESAAPAPALAAAPDTQNARQAPPQKLTTDSSGVPVAWTLQVATVSAADKAEALRKRLLEMHHKAYITTVSSGGKPLYRVCIGPKFERVELEKLQPVINAQFGVNTMVVRYVP